MTMSQFNLFVSKAMRWSQLTYLTPNLNLHVQCGYFVIRHSTAHTARVQLDRQRDRQKTRRTTLSIFAHMIIPMFGRNPSSSHRYDPLPAAESGDNKEEPAQQSDEAAALPRRRFPLFWTLYFVFMHCVILLLLLGLLLLLWSTSRGQKGQNAYSLLASELRELRHKKLSRCAILNDTAFARDSTRYLETVFSPSGFSDSSQQPSAYYGEPTPEKDRLWKSLYDGIYTFRRVEMIQADCRIAVGMVVITKEEYEQLDVETTTLVGDEDHYLVTLEVFHQLHCLVRTHSLFREACFLLTFC